ncbi:MAG: GAF and ANTAR domain-containing protein [Arthrobacter sp.]|uniref:GAF and ANTAR domain-containing protein n=1 Tax=Arthrobacter sp. TaxID=1667 RepID=UPI003492F60D
MAATLQDLVLASANIDEFLHQLAAHAAESLSTGETTVHCGATLLRDKKMATVASSGRQALELDELQYDHGDGPCLSAARTGTLVYVPDTVREARWRPYLDAIAPRGVGSILGVPLDLGDQASGALNFYATAPRAFGEETLADALGYARQAAASLLLALRIGRLAETRDHLKTAMASRTGIDLATGILMAQNRCGQQEAFEMLRAASSHRNIKIRDLAEQIVRSVGGGAAATYFKD